MNIYEKMQAIRQVLNETDLKKTGKNNYSNYSYFELADFMPTVIKEMNERKLFSVFAFVKGLATLTFVNTEKPDEFVCFESDIKEANLKGCHPIQNLGAEHTYMRRYLYVLAFDIIESDAIDSSDHKKETVIKQKQTTTTADETGDGLATPEQQQWILDMCKEGLEYKKICGQLNIVPDKATTNQYMEFKIKASKINAR